MKQFSVIKIICCLSIINLGFFEVYLMFKFGFDYWLNWMLALPITDLFWILAMVNFLIVVIGLMVWSRIEAVYIAYTPIVVIGLYILFVIIMKAANFRGQFLPFGMVHLFFLGVSIVASPFALVAINDELKYEWNTSIFGILGAPFRWIDRLIEGKPRQPEEPAEGPPEDWTTQMQGRQEPLPMQQNPEPLEPAVPDRPSRKWYQDIVDMERQRYKRK
jgi:hypothetical protein